MGQIGHTPGAGQRGLTTLIDKGYQVVYQLEANKQQITINYFILTFDLGNR